MASVAEKTSNVITANDVNTCHCLPTGDKDTSPVIAKFFRGDPKHQLMKKN